MGLGLLGKIKKFVGQRGLDKKSFPVYAPISGEVIPLDDVPDVIFSERIVGDGIAIKPSSNKIVAPIDGVVVQIFETNHCIVIRSETKVEVLVHFGIDTVELAGTGFKRIVDINQKVNVGDTLVELDLPYLEANAKSTITPIVISNSDEVHLDKIDLYEGKATAASSVIMNAYFKEVTSAGNS